MFDIGFWELVIIATVALLVVGPDKLPALARETGKWLGKFRRMINNLQRELTQELSMDEAKAYKDKIEDLDSLMKNAPDRDTDFSASSDTLDEKIDHDKDH